MRKAIAVAGAVGFGVAFGSVPAVAADVTPPPGLLICHATGAGTYEPVYVTPHGLLIDLNGHKGHLADIIPIGGYGGNPNGQNMTPENVAILNNGCVGTVAVPAAPVSPPLARAKNTGYNVDGAVQVTSSDAASWWLVTTAGLLATVGALVVRRAKTQARKTVR